MRSLFRSENIEYVATLDMDDVRLTYPELLSREDFEAKSVILYLVPYYVGECKNISTYASSLDYHIFIREMNEKVIAWLLEHFPGARAKGYGDHSPIDEIDAAVKAGLGVKGKNRLLINEKYGSYVFIGEVITDVPAGLLGRVESSCGGECLSCGRCLSACPTATLVSGAPCLSHITQKKGELTPEEVYLIKDNGTAWGCDACQRVCPHNNGAAQTPIEFFHRDRVTELTQEYLCSLSTEELRLRAFGWRGRGPLVRNLGILESDKADNPLASDSKQSPS